MVIDIIPHIEKLLFHHNTLVIPGLGAFQSHLINARPDASTGVVNPPSRSLNFNENLTVDDGLLVQDIMATHQVSEEDARKQIADFVANIQEQLNKREIVTFPSIGRLYKNYVQKIQFLPDSTNYHTDSYGLPPLQFSPIARSREVVENAIKQQSTQPEKQSAPTPKETTSEPKAPVPPAPQPTDEFAPAKEKADYLPIIGFAVIILLIVGGYFWFKPGQSNNTASNTDENTEALVNTAPGQDDADQNDHIETAGIGDPGTSEPDPTPPPASTQPEEKAPEKASTPGSQVSIAVIGTFGNQQNIARLKKLLSDNGFEVYEAPAKNGTQIGARVRYTDAQDKQEKLNTLKKLTGVSDLWVK
ncbi:MAG: hypothetical protein R2792_16200 [Saprospiraceae bacterium]